MRLVAWAATPVGAWVLAAVGARAAVLAVARAAVFPASSRWICGDMEREASGRRELAEVAGLTRGRVRTGQVSRNALKQYARAVPAIEGFIRSDALFSVCSGICGV